MPAIAVVIVAADVRGQEEAILDVALIFEEGGLVAVRGGEARRIEPLPLILQAHDQAVAPGE
ncbi:hypothetical protein D3C87_2186190 [compost metagenome]